MKIILALIVVIVPFFLCAQDLNVAIIPDSIKANANVVKRFEEVKVSIKSPSRAVVKTKYALTILNEEGQQHAYYVKSYNKMFILESVDGSLYDGAGKLIKTVKKKDISDVSYDDDMSLMTDSRLKRHIFYHSIFPYTIVYEDEVTYNGTFFLPSWEPVPGEKYGVIQSSFIVEVPLDYKLRYKFFNLQKPGVINDNKNITYQWEVKNLPGLRSEHFQPGWDEVTPTVYLAPTEFEFGGYKGNMGSWSDLGKYLNTLFSGRDQLPEKIKAEVRQLVSGVSDTKEKVRLVYEYMQQNTRYISIQLGIGGWQPYDASFVATKGYGDCKALSNYTVSMLKEAGVNGHPVIIQSGTGERGLWEDFPAAYFNHVVMCVPNGKDTMWLECTSQTTSAGYMGSNTGNRKALMLSQDGGHVVNTPKYDVKTNLQLRKVDAEIDEQGNLKAVVKTHFTGVQQELQHSLIHDATKEQRDKYLNRVISLPTYKIEKSEYKENKGWIPVVDEMLEITAPNYAIISGKRLFVVPNLFNKQGDKLAMDYPRKFDIKFSYAFKDVDTVILKVPAGYKPEAMGKTQDIKSKFGNYQFEVSFDGINVKMVRVYEHFSGLYPAADYEALTRFYEDIYKSDRSRVVLVKKE